MTTTTELTTQELPTWMRQARQGVDWGALLAVAFAVLLALPALTASGHPAYGATENHRFMASDVADALREGRLWPRWSPHAQAGYGAPIPHYYPPGAHLTVGVVEVLLTNDTVTALRLVTVLAACVGAGAVYALVTRRLGAASGLLAAVLYQTAPVIAYTTPYILGDIPLMVGHALIPVMLWMVNRLLVLDRPFDLLWVVLASASLLLVDGRTALSGYLLAFAVVTWHLIVEQRKMRGWRALAGLTLGLALAGFHWIPALIEFDLVRWLPPTVTEPETRLILSELFTPLQQLDPAQLNPIPQITLGVALPILSATGLLALVRRHRDTRFLVPYALVGTGLLAMVVFIIPSETWWLGVVSLCLALVGGATPTFARFIPERVGRAILPACMVLALIGVLPVWLLPVEASTEPTPFDQIRYEQQGFGAAVIPPGWRVPISLPPGTESSLPLLTSYRETAINRLAPDQITRDTRITPGTMDSHQLTLQVDTRRSETGQLLLAYFPGWQGWLGEQRLRTLPDPATGLVTVEIPATTAAELRVALEPTRIRLATWIISWVVLIGVLVISAVRYSRRTRFNLYDSLTLLDVQAARLVGVVLVSFCLIAVIVGGRLIGGDAPLIDLRAASNFRLVQATPAAINKTDVGLEIAAYELPQTRLTVADVFPITLHWRTVRPLPANFRVQYLLYDVNRRTEHIVSGRVHPGGLPTRRWITGVYVTDTRWLPLPDDLLAGTYQLSVEVYDCDQTCTPDDRLIFFDQNGERARRAFTLPDALVVINR